jgi:N-acyl-D-aspartate/D-glutamate deacylase
MQVFYHHCFRIQQQEGPRNHEMKLNGTSELLVYADNINILAENKNNIKRNLEALLEARSKCREKFVYMYMSHHRNTGQNQNFMIANNVQVPYKESNLTNSVSINFSIRTLLRAVIYVDL